MGRVLAIVVAAVGMCGLALGCSGAGSGGGSSESAVVSAPDVTKAVDGLTTANDAVDEVDRRLAEEVQLVGAALTQDQQQKYARAFGLLADVKDAHETQSASARTLDKALRHLVADSERTKQAMQGGWLWVSNGEVGYKQLYRDVALLAKSPVASFALEFGAKLIAGDPAYVAEGLTLDAFGKSEADVMNDIVVPALPRVAAMELAKADDEGRAKAAIKTIVAPLLARLDDADKVGALYDQVDAIHQVLDAVDTKLQDLVGADGNLLQPTLEADVSHLSSAIQAIETIFGLWHAGLDLKAFNDGDTRAFVKLLQSGPDAVSGVAEAANSLRQVILGRESLELGNIADFTGKISPAIGVLMDAIDTATDIEDAVDKHGADQTTILKIFGDFLAIASDALQVVTPANPVVAPAATVFAILVDLYVNYLEDEKRDELETRELPGLLAAAGFGDATVAAFSGLDKRAGRVISALASSPNDKKNPGPGLTPETIQWLGRSSPELLHKVGLGEHGLDRVNGLSVVVRAFGLDAAHARELLDASVAGAAPADAPEVLFDAFDVMRSCEQEDPSAPTARGTILDELGQEVDSATGDAKRRAAANGLVAYLKAR